MNFREISIEELEPADYNPRKVSYSEYEKLKSSIQNFGFVDPIIVNLKNMKIIGGHQRFNILMDNYLSGSEQYSTLKLVELGDIGWAFPDSDLEIKTESQEKALNVALNKISGEWDNEKLNKLMQDLSLQDFNIELTGFDDLELEQINLMEDLEFVPDDFEEEEEKEKVETKPIVHCPNCGCEF